MKAYIRVNFKGIPPHLHFEYARVEFEKVKRYYPKFRNYKVKAIKGDKVEVSDDRL